MKNSRIELVEIRDEKKGDSILVKPLYEESTDRRVQLRYLKGDEKLDYVFKMGAVQLSRGVGICERHFEAFRRLCPQLIGKLPREYEEAFGNWLQG